MLLFNGESLRQRYDGALVYFSNRRTLAGVEAIREHVKLLGDARPELSFDMDGAVIKVDSLEDRTSNGIFTVVKFSRRYTSKQTSSSY